MVEPLSIFSEQYESESRHFTKKLLGILNTVKEAKEEAQRAESNYLSAAECLHSDTKSIQASHLGPASEAAEDYKKYTQATARANSIIRKQEKQFTSVIEAIERMERDCIEFNKSLLIKHLKLLGQIARCCIDKTPSVEAEILRVSSKVSLKKWLLSDSLFQPISRIPYVNTETNQPFALLHSESTSKLLKNNSSEEIDLDELVSTIKNNKSFTAKQRTGIANLFSSPDACAKFSAQLDKFAAAPALLPKKAYQSLTEACTLLLASCTKRKDINPHTLNTVLQVSRKVMNEQREFLYAQIAYHYIWQDVEVWRKVIDFAIEREVGGVKDAGKRVEQGNNRLGDFFSKMKDAVSTGVNRILQATHLNGSDEASTKSAIHVLNTFCYYLSSPSINIGKVLKLYEDYGRRYNIPRERLKEFALDLRQCQRLSAKLCIRQDEGNIKKAGRYGNWRIHVLARAVKYTADRKTLRNLLMLSRSVNKMMRVKVFRQVLVNVNLKVSVKQRLSIWLQILDLVILVVSGRTSRRQITSS